MASIHGMWFVLIGLVVTIVSFFNELIGDGETSYIIFIFVGVGFVIYGGGKLLFYKSKTPTKGTSRGVPSQNVAEDKPQMVNPTAQKYQSQEQQQKILLCKKCGNRIRIHDNFCSHCGAQLKNFH